jgi:ABC-type transport system involved in multi-copper enzyme maturation permease subunit
MFWNITKSQILENLYGIKFIVTFFICMALIVGATISGVGRYEAQQRDQVNITTTNDANLKEAGSWRSAKRVGQKIVKPATPLVVFASGLENSVGRTATVREGDFPQMEDSIYSTAPIFAVFGDLDMTFIIKIVISLFAILFTYDLISGEKERGTLKLCLANSVPRNTYMLAKSLGAFISMLIPLLIPFIIALLVLMTVGGVTFSGDEWVRILLVLLGYTFYLLTFFSIGLVVSTATKRSAVSFLILLFVWVVIVLIVPKASMMVANEINPIKSVNEVRAEQIKLTRNYYTDIWSKTAELYQQRYPGQDFDWRNMRTIRNEVREELEPAYLQQNQQLIDGFKLNQRNLTNLAINLSRISPASAITYIGMNLSGTGYVDQEYFLRQLTDQRERFTDFIEKKEEEEAREWERNRKNLHTAAAQGELDISDMPKFKYQKLTLEESVESILPDLATLFILSIIFYLIAFVLFLKYDVR